MLSCINSKQLVVGNMKLIPFGEIACFTEPTNAANNPIAWAESAIGYLCIQRSEDSRERKAKCLFGLMQLCCRGFRILKASGEQIAARIPVENVDVSPSIHEMLVSARPSVIRSGLNIRAVPALELASLTNAGAQGVSLFNHVYASHRSVSYA